MCKTVSKIYASGRIRVRFPAVRLFDSHWSVNAVKHHVSSRDVFRETSGARQLRRF